MQPTEAERAANAQKAHDERVREAERKRKRKKAKKAADTAARAARLKTMEEYEAAEAAEAASPSVGDQPPPQVEYANPSARGLLKFFSKDEERRERVSKNRAGTQPQNE